MFNFFKNFGKEEREPDLKNALAKTSESLVKSLSRTFMDKEEFDEFALDDMEELLIKSDLGVSTSTDIIDKLRKQKIRPSEIENYLKAEFDGILKSAGSSELNYKDNELNLYFITGVNGAGKTTLIGKLAKKFKDADKKVLVIAADTFRAAAEEQLNIWSNRAGASILRRDKADPASVVFDGIKKAKDENFDVVLIDTAGRLQNKTNLMQELNKIKTVIDKNAPDSLRESILVLDANTGQNGLQQAKVFHESTNLTCVALTKLDGSGKGGIVITIAKELNLPVKLIGIGEKIDDLKNFDRKEFIEAIF